MNTLKARKTLRDQAIARTLREIEDPWHTWGFGLANRMADAGNVEWSATRVSAEAARRLETIRGIS